MKRERETAKHSLVRWPETKALQVMMCELLLYEMDAEGVNVNAATRKTHAWTTDALDGELKTALRAHTI